MAGTVYTVEEYVVADKRLGRHVEHVPANRLHPAMLASPEAPLRTLRHRRYGGVFNQGGLGSCTGMAAAGACNTKPVHAKGERVLHEMDAVSIYSEATELDPFPGVYPPDDTGSSGNSAAKALRARGLISRWGWAFGADEAVRALQLDPVIIGIPWLEAMDSPTAQGFLRPAGQVRGGHEVLLRGYVAARTPYVLGDNSWGAEWGPLGGKFKLFVSDLATLLDQEGDAVVLYA